MRNPSTRGQKFLAHEGHSLAANPTFHWAYFPLQNVKGHRVLLAMAPENIAPCPFGARPIAICRVLFAVGQYSTEIASMALTLRPVMP